MSGLLCSCRFSLTLSIAMGLLLHYTLRYILSMAIVCMVRQQQTNETESSLEIPDKWYDANETSSLDSSCVEDGSGNKPAFGYEGEFDWSRQLVGYILASYFYVYVLVQVPSGWLSSRFGGKHVFGFGMLLSGLATLLIPVCARLHVSLLIVLRVIIGMGTGVTFPTVHALMGCWVPPNERSRLFGICFSGALFGSVIAMVVTGQLCSIELDNGWPLTFYLFGGLTVLWWFMWMYVVYSKPEQHPRISQEEKQYILSSLGRSENEKHMALSVPWCAMFSTPAVWAIVVAHTAAGFGIYTVLTVIPLYMQDVLKFNIKQNGILSALPTILQVFATFAVATIADALITKKIFSTMVVRKIMQGVAQLGPLTFMLLLSYMECDQRSVAVALLCLAVVCMTGGRVGYQVNPADLSPKFAAIIYGFSNMIANVVGFVVPIVVGALTPNGTRQEWQHVFFICAGMYLVGFIVFTIFAKGEELEWSKQAQEKVEDYKLENKELEDPLHSNSCNLTTNNVASV